MSEDVVAKALVPMLCVGIHMSISLKIKRYAFPRGAWERGFVDALNDNYSTEGWCLAPRAGLEPATQ